MFWQKIGNSVSDRLFRDSVIAENQCLYFTPSFNRLKSTDSNTATWLDNWNHRCTPIRGRRYFLNYSCLFHSLQLCFTLFCKGNGTRRAVVSQYGLTPGFIAMRTGSVYKSPVFPNIHPRTSSMSCTRPSFATSLLSRLYPTRFFITITRNLNALSLTTASAKNSPLVVGLPPGEDYDFRFQQFWLVQLFMCSLINNQYLC